MDMYVKKNSLIFIYFPFFLVFNHDFIASIDFTRFTFSNTATDDVTNYVTQRIFNTNLCYSFAHFKLKTDE